MINLALAFVASFVVTVLFGLLLGDGGVNIMYGVIPGLIALIVTYLLLARRTLKQLEAVMNRAQAELLRMQNSMAQAGRNPSKQQMEQAVERTIAILKEGYALKSWQFLVDSQINGQIGSILYANRRFDESEPYLRNGFLKHWLPQAMLASVYFRKRNYDEMTIQFERAVKSNKKESLLWGIYAWCLWKNKDRDGAIKVLTRAKEFVTDPRIDTNLLALQNNKKMKMDKWDSWYQFQFERPSAAKMSAGMGGRRGSKRSVYR